MSATTGELLDRKNAAELMPVSYPPPTIDTQIKVEPDERSDELDIASLAETFTNIYLHSKYHVTEEANAEYFFALGGMSFLLNNKYDDIKNLHIVVTNKNGGATEEPLESFITNASMPLKGGLFKFLGGLALQRLEKNLLCPPGDYSKEQNEKASEEFASFIFLILELQVQQDVDSFYRLKYEIVDKLMQSSWLTFDKAEFVYQKLEATHLIFGGERNIPDTTSNLDRVEPKATNDPRQEVAKKLLSIAPNTANMPTEEVKDLLLDTRCVYINPDTGASLEDIRSYRQLTREAVLATLKYRRDKEQYGPETLNTLLEIDTESNAAGLVLRVLSSEDPVGIFEKFERYCERIKFGLQSAKEHTSYIEESYRKAFLMLGENPLAKRFLDRIEVLRKHNPYQVHTLQ